MENKRMKYVIYGGYIFVSVLLLVFVFLLGSLIYFGSGSEAPKKEARDYQILRLNTKTNQKSFGFVTFFDDLSPGEYISHIDEEMNTNTLISNVGETEYECRGSCFCKDTRDPFQTYIQYLEDFTLLLTSDSVSTATGVMDTYLKEECDERFSPEVSDVCSGTNFTMYSLTALCEPAVEADRIRKYVEDNYDIYNAEREFAYFYCKGNCFPVIYELEQFTKKSAEFGCDIIEKHSKLEIDISELISQQQQEEEEEFEQQSEDSEDSEEEDPMDLFDFHTKYGRRRRTATTTNNNNNNFEGIKNDLARDQFLEQEMKDFCQITSIHHSYYKDSSGRAIPVTLPLCMHITKYEDNPTIKCRPIARDLYYSRTPFREYQFLDDLDEGY